MRWTMADDGDQGTADTGVWTSVETTPIAPVTATGHPRATLAGGLLVLSVVVGAGLAPVMFAGPPPDVVTQRCPATVATPEGTGADPSVDSAGKVDVPMPASVIEPRPRIALLMPSAGEVVLGRSVLVAGRVNVGRPQPGVASTSSLRVVIVIGETIVGEADLPVGGNGFAGSMTVSEQAAGEVAEIRISDRGRPDQILLEHEVVLGPGSG